MHEARSYGTGRANIQDTQDRGHFAHLDLGLLARRINGDAYDATPDYGQALFLVRAAQYFL